MTAPASKSRSEHLAAARLSTTAVRALRATHPEHLGELTFVDDHTCVELVRASDALLAATLVRRCATVPAVRALLESGERRPEVVAAVCARFGLGELWQERLIREPELGPVLAGHRWLTPTVGARLSAYTEPGRLAALLTTWAPALDDAELVAAVRQALRASMPDRDSYYLSLAVADRPQAQLDLCKEPAAWVVLSRVASTQVVASLAGLCLANLGTTEARTAAANLIESVTVPYLQRQALHDALVASSPEIVSLWSLLPPQQQSGREAHATLLHRPAVAPWDRFGRARSWLAAARFADLQGDASYLVAAQGLAVLHRALAATTAEVDPVGADPFLDALLTLASREPSTLRHLVAQVSSPPPRPQPLRGDAIVALDAPVALRRDHRAFPGVRATAPSGNVLLTDLDALPTEPARVAWSQAASYLTGRLDGPRAELAWSVVWRLVDQFPGTLEELASIASATVAP